MLTPLWRGCAYVCMGAWSYLLDSKHYPRFFFFELNGCYLTAMTLFNLNTKDR